MVHPFALLSPRLSISSKILINLNFWLCMQVVGETCGSRFFVKHQHSVLGFARTRGPGQRNLQIRRHSSLQIFPYYLFRLVHNFSCTNGHKWFRFLQSKYIRWLDLGTEKIGNQSSPACLDRRLLEKCHIGQRFVCLSPFWLPSFAIFLQ